MAWDLLEQPIQPNKYVDWLGYGGAAGGAKTDLGCKLFTHIAQTFPGSHTAIGRNTLVDLKKTTLVSLFELFAKNNLQEGRNKDYHYNDELSCIEFSNSSVIFLVELKNRPRDPLYQNLGGLQLTAAWVEESNEVPSRAIEILYSRTGRRNVNPMWIDNLKQFFGKYDPDLKTYIFKRFMLETFNPGKGHVYTYFWKPFKKLLKENIPMPEGRAFVRALPRDNRYLSKDYLEGLSRLSKATKERLLYGNFDYDDDPQKLFVYDKITDLFTNTHVKEGNKYMVIDPAGKGRDKTVVSMWTGWRAYKWYMETRTDQSLLIPLLREFQKKEEIPNSNTICDYDGLGVGIVDQMKCKAFQGGSSPILSEEEKEKEMVSNYKNLRAQCFFLLADKVNKNEIYIKTPNTETEEAIIEELDVIKEINDGKDQKKQIIPKGSLKEDPTTETIRSQLGRSPDYADTLMMRMWFEVGSEAPLFFGVI